MLPMLGKGRKLESGGRVMGVGPIAMCSQTTVPKGCCKELKGLLSGQNVSIFTGVGGVSVVSDVLS